MRTRFDSRPLFMRRQYTAALRSTQVLSWRSQADHAAHLFCVIAAMVIGRNVAAQELLDAVGPRLLGHLYITVSVVAGLALAAIGWLSRGHDARSATRAVHGVVVALFIGSFFASHFVHGKDAVAITKYIALEIASAALLFAFALMLGASLGPREARKVAARVGLGGILGGLAAGLALKVAPFVGSRYLFFVAAAFALAPVFWLPKPTVQNLSAPTKADRAEVQALAPYGRWVAITTLLMVATTTIIDYQYRAQAASWYRADRMTSFFGDVALLTGVLTLLLQLTLVNRLLDRVGLFATATVMPGALIVCSAAFGMAPTLATLMVLKLVDSGTNMTVQQATGSLLLAPLGARARAIWQGRIDGIAKRGGQALAGLYLASFPVRPPRLVPVVLVLCATWLVAVLITRLRYVHLLTDLLASSHTDEPEVTIYDGATLRHLMRELAAAPPARAAVILDLLESAGAHAPTDVLKRLASSDPSGAAALRVIEHYAALQDVAGLTEFADDVNSEVAAAALMALVELEPQLAVECSRRILGRRENPDPLRALAAGVLIDHDRSALELCRQLAGAHNPQTRLAAARAFGLARPTLTQEITPALAELAEDPNTEVARTALSSLARHPNERSVEVALRLLARRELRSAAMRALAEQGLIVVSPVAQALHEQQSEPRVATALTWVLGRIGSQNGVPALVVALGAPHVDVRLSAALALVSMRRRHPEMSLAVADVAARYEPEIEYFAAMRDASLCDMPSAPAANLLRGAFKQRANASLEALFRMLSLQYAEDSIQGAYRALTSDDGRERQIALELLHNLLEAPVSQALSDAVGDRARKQGKRDARKILTLVARDRDKFLAGLARYVLVEMGAAPRSALNNAMTQSLVNQVLELQALSLFQHSSAEDLAEVATLLVPRTAPPKTVLFSQGEQPDALYLIRSGAVELVRDGKAIDRLGPGDACGIIAVLDQLPREVMATTVSECSLLVINGDAMVQLLSDRPTLMHGVFRALTSSIRNQLDRVGLERRARA